MDQVCETLTGRFTISPQIELFYRSLVPKKPSLVLVFIHGAGQHSGLFMELGTYCSQNKIAFHALDLRGFGHSTGKRGHAYSFLEYLDDIEKFIGLIRSIYPGHPIFLFGHSFGGTVVIRYGQERPNSVDGAVLCAPALRLRVQIPKYMYRTCQFLSVVTPKMTIDLNQWYQLISRIKRTDPREKIIDDEEDPLCSHRYSFRWLSELLVNGANALLKVNDFQMASLCLCGADDMLVDSAAVKEFHDGIPIEDKTYMLLKGSHCLLQGDGRESTYKDIVGWLHNRVEGAATPGW